MIVKLTRTSGVGSALLGWWKSLADDRGSRAVLRRAASITAVSLSAPYQRAYRLFCNAGWPKEARPYENDRLAAIVGLLAHIERDDGRSPAKAMSDRSGGDDRPPVSELRFQRLIESPDLEALFSGLRRCLPMIGHSVDVLALAEDVLNWGDSVKKRWAYSYEWPEKSRS